jgi:nitrate/TMAO reductase-like tetraheme cytochrome c subunit
MEPEYTTYLHSPHARVSCSECHIGPGAAWYVKAKISGTYQVYSVLFEKYHRPIETPIKNLRPAQDTCERCHWPQKFVGNLDVTYSHFLADETNTPYSVRMLLKVGGGDPTHGPVGGIHWHMNVANKIEYIAKDEKRMEIPWVRMTDASGNVREYRTSDFKDDPANQEIRKMDCMDCHNRPTHIFKSPSKALDLSLALGRLDPSMPNIKKNGIEILAKPYASNDEAMGAIAAAVQEKYPGDPRAAKAVEEIQRIYSLNFFPKMKSSWQVYPSHIGHMEWAGCFRCHDGEHVTADSKHTISSDCNACHTILAQGSGANLEKMSAQGLPFEHPGGEIPEGLKCNDCHTGAAMAQ